MLPVCFSFHPGARGASDHRGRGGGHGGREQQPAGPPGQGAGPPSHQRHRHPPQAGQPGRQPAGPPGDTRHSAGQISGHAQEENVLPHAFQAGDSRTI